MKSRMKRAAAFSCAVLVLSAAPCLAGAQERAAQFDPRQAVTPAIAGTAIDLLLAKQLTARDLRKLATDSQTARQHPDLAAFYRSRAQDLQAESERYGQFAHKAGGTLPVGGGEYYGVSRSARFDYLVAENKLRQSQNDRILAALHAQASQQEGCFLCHSLNGRGGKAGPDLAKEGKRGRSNAWLIEHFKNPQAAFPGTAMPSFGSLTSRQLETLAAFLQYQRAK